MSYFFLPPEEVGSKTVFPQYIPQVTLVGLTLLGVIGFSGRFLDAIIDPFMANFSDKTNSKIGKRKIFMAMAAVPLALMSYLIFRPITEGVSNENIVWLVLTVLIYYISFAM